VGSRLESGRRLLIVLALLLAAGCYWSKYDKLTRTHVQLLVSMAQKLDEVARAEGGPPASFAEYRYPLERARDFTRIVAGRFEGRPSLAAFRMFCDAYEDVLRAAESLRGDGGARDELRRAHATLDADAAAVLKALDAEAR
jgi:hypothetical protein